MSSVSIASVSRVMNRARGRIIGKQGKVSIAQGIRFISNARNECNGPGE